MRAEKRRRLKRIGDREGLLRILANEHRLWLREALRPTLGRDASEDELKAVKAAITSALVDDVSAVLLDFDYGVPAALGLCPPETGVLVSYETLGFRVIDLARLQDPPSRPVADALSVGADGVKLQVYYHPDAPGAVLDHQRAIVRDVGVACAKAELPFFLEPSGYALHEGAIDSPGYALAREEIVLRTIEEFGRADYHADVLMLEFPADLKYTTPFAGGVLDGKVRSALYDLKEVSRRLSRVRDAVRVPWLLVGAGVGWREFVENLFLAAEHGACGYLGGWSFFRPALAAVSDPSVFHRELRTRARWLVRRANAAVSGGTPWHA